jgi:chitin disaccharide deacetylase
MQPDGAVPTAPHAMDLLRQHPRIPFGIHLTLVCDIPGIRWEPLAAREKASSLLSETGELFTPAQLPRLLVQARLDEVELEFRAQVNAVADAGLTPTHLDWHCLADGGRDDIFDPTVALASEYGLAVRAWLEPARRKLRQRGLPAVDHQFLDSFRLGTDGKSARYAKLLHDLPAGLSEWAVHPALGDEQSQMIDPGWRVRRTDYDFLTSPQATALLEDERIVVIDYRTIQRAWSGSPGRLLAVLGVKDGVPVRLGPLSQHRDRADQGTAERGELIFDSGRGLGVGMAGHQPAALEPAQRVREHLAGDAADQPGQLAVPSRLVGEAVQDHNGPLIGDDLNGQPGRAVGQEHVASSHEPKGTNRFLSAS